MDETSTLDSMVCFAVYSAANAVAQAHRAALEPWGLTYTQYIALIEVAGTSAGLTVGELGRRMQLDSGTLSPLLRRLDERGLVTRERRSADERVVTVTATDAGRSVRGELAEAIACVNAAYGFGSREEASELITSLNRVAAGMHELTATTRATPAATAAQATADTPTPIAR